LIPLPVPKKKHSKPGLAFIAGNFYDAFKVPSLVTFAESTPKGDILCTGGRDGRLTGLRAGAMGGEPLELQARLVKAGVDSKRLIVWNGGKVTTSNMQALVLTHEEELDWSDEAPITTYYEEGYLMRRGRATLSAVLSGHVYGGVRTECIGAATLEDLLTAHKGQVDVVAFLLLGEITRLVEYSDASRPRALFDAKAAWEGVAPSNLQRCLQAAKELRTGALAGELNALEDLVRLAPKHVVLHRLEPRCPVF
jgi:hypothetical protein